MAEKQLQTGNGDGSTLNQAMRDIVINQAPSPEYIFQIIDARMEIVRRDTEYAQVIAEERMARFVALASNGLLQFAGFPVFKDPDFQMNITEAGRSAIRSEKESDYELLVTILRERAKSDATARHKLATRKAIEVVGQIDDNNLASLALLWATLRLEPIEHTCGFVLFRIENELSTLMPRAIQSGSSWVDDLITLDCAVSSAGYFITFAELFVKKFPSFFCKGMDENEAKTAKGRLKRLGINPESFITRHPTVESCYVLVGKDEKTLRELIRQGRGKPLTDSMEKIINSVIALNKYNEIIPDAKNAAEKLFEEFPNLKQISDWWKEEKINHIRLTSTGNALAYTYYRKCNPMVSMPELSAFMV